MTKSEFLLAIDQGTTSSRAIVFDRDAAIAAVALFGVGAAMSLFSGKNALFGGIRMLAIGAAAGAATFAIGSLFGVAAS